MSVYSGPEIANNGLVMAIDTGVLKGAHGAGADRIGYILPTFGSWSGMTGTCVTYKNNGVYLNTLTSGGVNYWNSVNAATACLSSTEYVVSAKVKITGSSTTPHPNLFYVRQYNSSGTQTSESGKFNSSNWIPIGDDYYFTWAYFTTDSTATTFLVQGYEYSANMNIWLEDVRCYQSGTRDLTGNGNDPRYYNGAAYSAQGITFDGSNDYASIPNTVALRPPAELTISFWIKRTAALGGWCRVFGQDPYSGGPLVFLENDTSIRALHYPNGTETRCNTSVTAPLNTWKHVAFTFKMGDAIRSYFDGVASTSVALAAGSFSYNTSNPYLIGLGSPAYLPAVVANLNFYNRALTQAEITNQFTATRVRFGI